MTEPSDERAEIDRLHRLVEHTHDVVVIVGVDGSAVDANPATARILGYSHAESVSMNAVDIVHPQDLPRAAEHFANALQGVSSIDPIDVRIRRKDGSWRWFEVRVDPIDSATFALNAHDVTDRRRSATIVDAHTRALSLMQGDAPLAEVVAVVGESVRDLVDDDDRVAVVCVGNTQLVWAPDLQMSWARSLTVGLQGAETAVVGLEALLDSLSSEHDLPQPSSTPIRTHDGRDVGTILVYRHSRRRLSDVVHGALGSFADIISLAVGRSTTRNGIDAVGAREA